MRISRDEEKYVYMNTVIANKIKIDYHYHHLVLISILFSPLLPSAHPRPRGRVADPQRMWRGRRGDGDCCDYCYCYHFSLISFSFLFFCC